MANCQACGADVQSVTVRGARGSTWNVEVDTHDVAAIELRSDGSSVFGAVVMVRRPHHHSCLARDQHVPKAPSATTPAVYVEPIVELRPTELQHEADPVIRAGVLSLSMIVRDIQGGKLRSALPGLRRLARALLPLTYEDT